MRKLVLFLFLTLPAFSKPTLWIIGDSTVRNNTAGQQGWGDPLAKEFDPAKITVVNRAIGGRSSRSFLTEGRWEAVLSNMKKGDFVLMQFGHNDGGDRFKGSRPRASIKGTGEETETGIVEATGKEETVHSFGWYMRKYCQDTLDKGATPIVVSLIPRNIRNDEGLITADTKTYAKWAEESAAATKAYFVPFNQILSDKFNELGKEETDAIFCGTDHTHTSPKGATFNARVLAEALRQMPNSPLADHLLAKLWMPHLFSNHMVLQREQPIPVWGRSHPGDEIKVTLAESEVVVKADETGHWSASLPAMPAGGPHILKVENSETLTFEDVLIGEVWLCSGQSNMDFTVASTEKRYFAGTSNWEREIEQSNQPKIRMFTAEWTMTDEPFADVEGTWKVATPESVKDFSAVAWFFALDLQKELQVPIGLITSAYGGSIIEAWISPEKLAELPVAEPLLKTFKAKKLAYRDDPDALTKYGEALAKWEAAGKRGRAPKHPDPVQDQHNPSVLYNGMISPVIRYGIRGAIWYQGESNVGTRNLYPDLQAALIEDWRTSWGHDFPFYYVQLASYKAPKDEPADSSLAAMREAQATSLTIPHTGMAITTDIGDEKDIHPRNKQDVGARLARLALAGTYGEEIVPTGPTLQSATIEGEKIRLSFENVAGGLTAKDGELRHFAIAGEDKKFLWGTALIEGANVIVSHADISAPEFVRYAWSDNPVSANLTNSEGLPAAPFRTDR